MEEGDKIDLTCAYTATEISGYLFKKSQGNIDNILGQGQSSTYEIENTEPGLASYTCEVSVPGGIQIQSDNLALSSKVFFKIISIFSVFNQIDKNECLSITAKTCF